MISISVFPIIRDNDYPTAGNVVYGMIMKNIDSVDVIDLDMKDVTLIPSMFLNTSLGRIIKEKGVSFLKNRITFSNIKVSDANRIKEYVGRYSS